MPANSFEVVPKVVPRMSELKFLKAFRLFGTIRRNITIPKSLEKYFFWNGTTRNRVRHTLGVRAVGGSNPLAPIILTCLIGEIIGRGSRFKKPGDVSPGFLSLLRWARDLGSSPMNGARKLRSSLKFKFKHRLLRLDNWIKLRSEFVVLGIPASVSPRLDKLHFVQGEDCLHGSTTRSGFVSPFCIFQPLEKQRVGNTCETASSSCPMF